MSISNTNKALNHPATLTAAVPSATIRRVKNDLWLYIAAGGLAFLILEWLVFIGDYRKNLLYFLGKNGQKYGKMNGQPECCQQ